MIESRWEAPGAGEGPVWLTVRDYTRSDRVRTGLRSLLLPWALAVPALFIPVLHFLLVPALILIGIGLGLRTARLERAIHRAEGTCPRCRETVQVELGRAAPDFPIWTFCPRCDDRLRIEQPP